MGHFVLLRKQETVPPSLGGTVFAVTGRVPREMAAVYATGKTELIGLGKRAQPDKILHR